MAWDLNLRFEDKDGEYLERFAKKVGMDWKGVVMAALAMLEAVEEGVLDHGKTIVLKGGAYGPFDGLKISPWMADWNDPSKPLGKVIAFPGDNKKREPG